MTKEVVSRRTLFVMVARDVAGILDRSVPRSKGLLEMAQRPK